MLSDSAPGTIVFTSSLARRYQIQNRLKDDSYNCYARTARLVLHPWYRTTLDTSCVRYCLVQMGRVSLPQDMLTG